MALLQRKASKIERAESRSAKTRTGRTVVASAAAVNLNDRAEVSRLARARQSWQSEAWIYRRSLGELRYATNYLGNSCMRLRLYPGTYVPGTQIPVELNAENTLGLPADLVAAAVQVLADLSNGSPVGAQTLVKSLTENFQVAGECYLIGEQREASRPGDPPVYDWNVRSISEIDVTMDGALGLREMPGSSKADVKPFDLTKTYVSRLWTPDPEWKKLADSPFHSILDLCEELLLLGRDVRATVRSRIANNGLLLVPDDLTVIGDAPEGDDDEDDPFFASLMAAAEAAMANEGDAGAAVPLVIRGPATGLAGVKHVLIDRPQNKFNIQQRAEIIGRMATGIDLPAEVLTGKVDLNHWSVWQVDDDTFRHHIEPTAIQEVGSLTVGYLWRRLDAMQKWAPEIVRKVLVWYDPTELVTHPDRTNDAMGLWDRVALSDEALRRVTGFPEDDAPSDDERLLRVAMRVRSLDPILQGQILRILDPKLDIPEDPNEVNDHVRDTPQDPAPPAPNPGPPPEPAAAARARLELAAARTRNMTMRALVASVTSENPEPVPDYTLSRALLDSDRRLRERIHTAANTSIRRALERAGARVATKARGAQHASIRELIKDVPIGLVAATVGPRLLATLDLSENLILDTEYAEMRKQWDKWVADAQNASLRDIARATGLDFTALTSQYAMRFAANSDRGWNWLQNAMKAAASSFLAKIDELDPEFDISTSDLVMVGEVRAALGLAGGFGEDGLSAGLSDEGIPLDPSEMMGQIGTGDTMMSILTSNGYGTGGYEWVWGGSGRPFEPHRQLNGQQYQSWDDSVLSNGNETFPAGGVYFPGDHSGCSCDFMPIVIPNAASAAA